VQPKESTDEVEIEEPTDHKADEAQDTDESETDLKAELEKWKAMSRKNEAQAKANASATKELEAIKKASLTDQERLIESTRDETRQAMRLEFAGKLVDAELKSALTGKVLEGNALLDFNKSAFIDDSGDIDTEAIQAWVEAHTKPAEPSFPDLGQGARGKTNSGSSQIRSREELSNMSPQDILAARKDGRLDALMGKQ
jgi:DNA polymerase III alpha subunit (gram-positive type)